MAKPLKLHSSLSNRDNLVVCAFEIPLNYNSNKIVSIKLPFKVKFHLENFNFITFQINRLIFVTIW